MNATNDINNSDFTVKADENVVMSAKNINNIDTSSNSNETRIEAGKMVSLDATNDITNTGATIKGGELVYLTAGNNITNKALVNYTINGQTATEDQALNSGANNIKSTLINKGNIESDGDIVIVAKNNINNVGSNIKATGSAYLEATNGDINITTAELRNKTTTTGGSKKNSWTKVEDKITNVQSEITAGNDLIMVAGDDANIIGSKIKATDQININVGDDLNIVNAKDSTLSTMETIKKGSIKTKTTQSGDYSETAVKSEIEADKINLSADGDIFVRSSNLKTTGDLNIGMNTLSKDSSGNYITDSSGNYVTNNNKLVDNLTITDDKLNSYSYSYTTKSYNGIAKVGANLTSTLIESVGLMLIVTGFSQIDAIDNVSDNLRDNSAYNVKVKQNTRTDRTTIAQSTINAGNDLNIHTNEDTTIRASSVNAGKDAGATTGELNITADNLNILADQDTTLTNHDEKKTRTLTFNNWNDGSFTENNTTNSTLTAKNDSFNFTVTDKINTSYDAKIFNAQTGVIDNTYATQKGVDTSALQYLTNIQTNHNSQALYNPIEETNKQWGDATRGLTEAGTATVAIAAAAAVILTAGSAATLLATVGTAVGSAAASTAAVSATNTSMNADGDLFKQVGDIGEQTVKDTTSDQALRSYAIAGATAGLTYGLTNGVNEFTKGTSLANNAVVNAVNRSLIQSVSSSVVESSINGDSFSEAFENSTKNLLINAAGAMAANQIGGAAKVGDITRTEQLLLHAGLGCAMSAAGGNNCASGAAAGVMGELTAGYLDRNTNMTDAQIIEASKMVGALTAANVSGPDDGGSVFAGSQIARNAAENNALYFRDKKLKHTDWITTEDVKDFDLNLGVQGNLTHVNGSYGTDGTGLAVDLNPSIGGSAYFSISPRGERVVGSNALGFKNLFSAGPLYTNKGNAGFSGSLGLALPLYPIPVNATVNVPLDKLHNSNK